MGGGGSIASKTSTDATIDFEQRFNWNGGRRSSKIGSGLGVLGGKRERGLTTLEGGLANRSLEYRNDTNYAVILRDGDLQLGVLVAILEDSDVLTTVSLAQYDGLCSLANLYSTPVLAGLSLASVLRRRRSWWFWGRKFACGGERVEFWGGWG